MLWHFHDTRFIDEDEHTNDSSTSRPVSTMKPSNLPPKVSPIFDIGVVSLCRFAIIEQIANNRPNMQAHQLIFGACDWPNAPPTLIIPTQFWSRFLKQRNEDLGYVVTKFHIAEIDRSFKENPQRFSIILVNSVLDFWHHQLLPVGIYRSSKEVRKCCLRRLGGLIVKSKEAKSTLAACIAANQ